MPLRDNILEDNFARRIKAGEPRMGPGWSAAYCRIGPRCATVCQNILAADPVIFLLPLATVFTGWSFSVLAAANGQ